MIIECPYCESLVDGRLIGEHESYNIEDPYPFKVVLLECPKCKESLVGCQELIQTGPDEESWINGQRLWPEPPNFSSWVIPGIIRESLIEAEKCFKAKAYIACAVMCGRALEGVCKSHKTSSKTIASGLKELVDRKIIDDRLYRWGEALREQRNLGAHATEMNITKEDARDILDFANAICNYIFVLTDKFEKYLKRQEQKKSLSSGKEAISYGE